nr:MAG TPA: hypothetical protein [Bacteriophage sp.]
MPAETVETRFIATDGVTPVVKAIGSGIEHVNGLMGTLNKVGNLVGLGIGITSVAAAGNYLIGTVNRAISVYQSAQQQQMKLTTIMRQRMGANNEMIASINSLIGAETKLGVVGGGAQRAGAQQLATFLSTEGALKTLIPAMNNLAVQQHGYNVSAESMVGLGNLMGKVMQGQTAALRRVGITFSEAEEQALKYGTEEERAATLAKVITNNVGEMNKVFGQTPEGQKIQATNRLAGAWANLGSKISGVKAAIEAQFANMQADTINQWADGLALAFTVVAYGVGYAVQALSWFASTTVQVIEILSPFLAILGTAYAIYRAAAFALAAYGVVQGTVAASTRLLRAVSWAYLTTLVIIESVQKVGTAIMAAYRSGTLMATAAQWLLNIAMKACPAVWLVMAIAAVIAVIVACASSMGDLSDVAADVWSAIVDTITGAINLIIDAINVLISGINKVASLSNSVFHTHFSTIAEVSHVSGEGIKAAGINVIKHGFTMPDLTPQMPEIPTAPSVGGADIPGVGGSGGGDDSTGRAIKDNTGKTADNTKMIADSISMTDEEIKQLREMAERDVMVSWQQQTFNVHVNNDNTINNGTDIDGMTTDIVTALRQAMEMDREGVR